MEKELIIRVLTSLARRSLLVRRVIYLELFSRSAVGDEHPISFSDIYTSYAVPIFARELPASGRVLSQSKKLSNLSAKMLMS